MTNIIKLNKTAHGEWFSHGEDYLTIAFDVDPKKGFTAIYADQKTDELRIYQSPFDKKYMKDDLFSLSDMMNDGFMWQSSKHLGYISEEAYDNIEELGLVIWVENEK